MSDVVYAVHTSACTYLLDDSGVCQWVLSRHGTPADDRCVGAQFVACLDPAQPGALVGELQAGGAALFVRAEEGRFVLLRTKPIELVEMKGESGHPPPDVDGEIPVDVDPYQDVPAEETASLPPIAEEVHARIVEAARAAWSEPSSPAPPPPPRALPAPPDIPSRWTRDAVEPPRAVLPPLPRPVRLEPPAQHLPLVDDLAITRPDASRAAPLGREAHAAVSAATPPLPTWVSRGGHGSGFRVEPPDPAAVPFDPRATTERMELDEQDVVELSPEDLSSEITITNPLFRRAPAPRPSLSHQRGKLLR